MREPRPLYEVKWGKNNTGNVGATAFSTTIVWKIFRGGSWLAVIFGRFARTVFSSFHILRDSDMFENGPVLGNGLGRARRGEDGAKRNLFGRHFIVVTFDYFPISAMDGRRVLLRKRKKAKPFEREFCPSSPMVRGERRGTGKSVSAGLILSYKVHFCNSQCFYQSIFTRIRGLETSRSVFLTRFFRKLLLAEFISGFCTSSETR